MRKCWRFGFGCLLKNTEMATTIWDYSLMPKDVPHPDIVIHAYATKNDMHVLSEIEAKKRNMTLEDMVLKVNQQFVRKVLTPRRTNIDTPNTNRNDDDDSSAQSQHSTPSLLIYFDDYIGNEQCKIIESNAFSKASKVVSSYYGFSLVSYTDAVKDVVYSHTNETWFSPHGWPERQVHPGMGMHIVSTWVMAFNLLHLAGTYCDTQGSFILQDNSDRNRNNNDNSNGECGMSYIVLTAHSITFGLCSCFLSWDSILTLLYNS